MNTEMKFKYMPSKEYSATLKRKEMLTHDTTWMNAEDIMLNEMSYLKKKKLNKKADSV